MARSKREDPESCINRDAGDIKIRRKKGIEPDTRSQAHISKMIKIEEIWNRDRTMQAEKKPRYSLRWAQTQAPMGLKDGLGVGSQVRPVG